MEYFKKLDRYVFDKESMISRIIILNVALFVLSLLLNPRIHMFLSHPQALLVPENKSLLLLGATGTIPIDRLGRWWTLITANYLHGSILHIFFNMFALNQIGRLVVNSFGPFRMIILYTAGGVAGFFISYLAGINFTIGASAAICSLIGASLYFGKSTGGRFGRSLFRSLAIWTGAIFIFGFLVEGINNWGHAGGVITGIILAPVLGYYGKKEETAAHRQVARLCVILTLTSILWAISTGLWYRFG